MSEIYWENQTGGRCRMHSLNACYGKHAITPEEFDEWCFRYNEEYKDSSLPRAEDFDGVLANQENIVAYIMRHKSNHGVLFCPPDGIKQMLKTWGKKTVTELIDPNVRRMFVFSDSHMWLCRYAGRQWVKVDSLSGLTVININSLANARGLGIMPVLSHAGMLSAMVNIQTRVKRSIKRMLKDEKGKYSFYSRSDLSHLICVELACRRGITAVEVNLCTFFHLLRQVDDQNDSLVAFDLFFVTYQRSPGDLKSVIKFVPALLHFICMFDFEPKAKTDM
jgi:hypothetical protein